MSSYALSLVNTLVSFGLLLLYTRWYRSWEWDPPYHAPKPIIILFFLSNLFLVTVPFFPPSPGAKTYDRLPYWVSAAFRRHTLKSITQFTQAHSAGGLCLSLLGVCYWYVWSVWLPQKKAYRLERRWVLQDDGVSRYAFYKVPIIVSAVVR